jgi:hypothetical protein
MHNELFNPIDIFTYYQKALVRKEDGSRWGVLGRDLWPEAFLDHIWSGRYSDGSHISESVKAVGFKSFPEHWTETRNERIWEQAILEDFRVKKVILYREDEVAVYVSMKRAEITGNYMTISYPKKLKISIDPAVFQTFVNNYRDTYRRKYKSPMERQDSFRVTYEEIVDEQTFELEILPKLWDFIGVDSKQPLKKLRETVRQADPEEDLSKVIENYEELEFCFRYTDVLHFVQRLGRKRTVAPAPTVRKKSDGFGSWSILLPVCSRVKSSVGRTQAHQDEVASRFNSNRLIELATTSQYDSSDTIGTKACWDSLERFAESLMLTADEEQLTKTECVVGIDEDDPVFSGEESRKRIKVLLYPCQIVFVDISPQLYGRVCKIWNHLAQHAHHSFLVLLGDDIILQDFGWQRRVKQKFHEIADTTGLPFGAACVALWTSRSLDSQHFRWSTAGICGSSEAFSLSNLSIKVATPTCLSCTVDSTPLPLKYTADSRIPLEAMATPVTRSMKSTGAVKSYVSTRCI